MRSSGLGGVLGAIVNVVIASTVGVVSGCDGEATENATTSGDAGADSDGVDAAADADNRKFTDDATFGCESPLPEILPNLKPATPIDFVELREAVFEGSWDSADPPKSFRATASYGSPCLTTNRDACVAALASATLAKPGEGWSNDGDVLGPGFGDTTRREYVVYTRAGEVGVLRTVDDVVRFLAPIETLEEARLLLRTRNQILTCTTAPARSGWRRNQDGSWEFLVAGYGCGVARLPFRLRSKVTSAGAIENLGRDSTGKSVCGRRPEGLCSPKLAHLANGGVAEHFARAAYLEAASVVAFRRLELELRRFGAPRSLVDRARRSRADEIRHAQETASLARRFGATVPALDVAPMRTRDVFACALENEIEGCVRETYGALEAAFQSRMATPELRPMLRRIAVDEAKHAELAHDVARFLRRKLTAEQRAELDCARAETLAELRRHLSPEPTSELVDHVGMPTAAQALALLDGLEVHLLAS